MGFNNNLEPNMYSSILYERRTGGFVEKTEQLMVRDGRVLLSELPSQFERVSIDGGDIELWIESENEIVPVVTNPTPGVPKTAYYTVNYSQGFVYFDHSFNGKTLTFKYKGAGAAYFPASRIYTKTNGLDVTETMEDVLLIADDTLKLADRFKYVGEYNDIETYFHRNIVKYGNALYMCILRNFDGISNQLPTNEEYWQLISRGFSFKNEFDLNTIYMNGDMVITSDHDELYICVHDKVSQKQLSENAYWIKVFSIKEVVAVLQSKIDEYENTLKPDIVEKTNLAQEKADIANEQAEYAKSQGDYAKEQGNYAKEQGVFANQKGEFANEKANLANEKAELAQEKATYAENKGNFANEKGEFANNKGVFAQEQGIFANQKGEFANEKANLANEKAALANTKAELAQEKADIASQKADIAQEKADIANTQAEYAKSQGDYAKEQGTNAKNTKDSMNVLLENFVHRGNYDSTTEYKKFNIVVSDGSSYIAIQDNTGQPISDMNYWRMIASIGFDGGNLVYRGIYDGSSTYRANDLVKYDNAIYSCVKECRDITPQNDEYWKIFVSGGGDMSTDIYDSDKDGIIDHAKLSEDSRKLGGKDAEEYDSEMSNIKTSLDQIEFRFGSAIQTTGYLCGFTYLGNSPSGAISADLSDLTTQDKTSLVAAINELVEKTSNNDELTGHIGKKAGEGEGVHGFRYNADNDMLEYYNGQKYVPVASGQLRYPPADVVSTSSRVRLGKDILIWWKDPKDTYLDNKIITKWAGTKVVYKIGSPPVSVDDGVLVIDNKIRDKYWDSEHHNDNAFVLSGFSHNDDVYIKFFPYSDKGLVSNGGEVILHEKIEYTPPKNVINLTLSSSKNKIKVQWQDPEDFNNSNYYPVTWSGTQIRYKAGSPLIDENDGILVIDSKVKNQYKDSWLEINGLINGVEYYIQAFPYNQDNVFNTNVENSKSTTPQAYLTMGVEIDYNNSNPKTSVKYIEDAVGMTPNSEAWDEFFGYYPCMLKNGIEGVKLNPNDYSKSIDGKYVDITEGNHGDVMVCFPKRGYKIETVDGHKLRVYVTDDPNKGDGFVYYGHQRGSVIKEKLYIGAYLGSSFLPSAELSSLAQQDPATNSNISTYRWAAQLKGSGYDILSFYPLTYLQCLGILRMKSLDSQTSIGKGWTNQSNVAATGRTNTKGMNWGEQTGKHQVKFLGIEDFWGNVYQWIDGLICDSSRNIMTATQNFNDNGSGYTNRGRGANKNISGWISKVQGTSEAGFVIKQWSGSQVTYFSDYGCLGVGGLPFFGGHWSYGAYAGLFQLDVTSGASSSSLHIGARLMFL